MLMGGKWGDSWTCPVCSGSNSGARLKCHRCEYKTLDTSPERVEKTAESLHDEPSKVREIVSAALDSGAAYTNNPVTGEPIYLFDRATLVKFLALSKPERLTDELIGELWHQSQGQHHRFARLLERHLVE